RSAARMRARQKAQHDVSCCSPFDDSTPPAPQVSNRATADDNWRRQKAQHTTHNVGMIVVTIARVLDGVFAASMLAPLKQAKLANEPRIVGQPRQTAREHRQAFEVDAPFGRELRMYSIQTYALVLDRKKLAAFSALGGGFLQFFLRARCKDDGAATD